MSMPTGKQVTPVSLESTQQLERCVRDNEEWLQAAHPGPYSLGVLNSRGVAVLAGFAPVHRILPLMCAVYSVNQGGVGMKLPVGRPRKGTMGRGRLVILRAPGGGVPNDADDWRVVRPHISGDVLQAVLQAMELFKYHPVNGEVMRAMAGVEVTAGERAGRVCL